LRPLEPTTSLRSKGAKVVIIWVGDAWSNKERKRRGRNNKNKIRRRRRTTRRRLSW
jgi:hypothetical protein